jgi:1,4-alpha-glucan branching enzyme
MQKKKESRKANRKRVAFTLAASDAQEVAVVGSFNNWNPQSHTMKKDNKGMWTKFAMLTPGTYEYRFLVDGKWWNDPRNEHTVPNCFGSLNNCLTVR